MQLNRIYAIVLRYAFLFRHSFDRLSDSFYWPTIDLIIWGLTGAFIQHLQSRTGFIIVLLISGLVFWNIIWRAQYEITVNLLEDFWDRNLINIFVSPLKFSEWIASFLALGFIKSCITLVFMSILAYFMYKVQIFSYGLYLIPFFAMLMMTGWSVGLFVTGLILRVGTRIQTFAWAMVAIIQPFSAVYYPVSILPHWAQTIAYLTPATYIFEGMRQVIYTHTLDPQKLLISFVLNIVYFIPSLIFLKKSFHKFFERGLLNVD